MRGIPTRNAKSGKITADRKQKAEQRRNFLQIRLQSDRKRGIMLHSICPWHSWIARETPTLEAAGSNPVGQARKTDKPRLVGFSTKSTLTGG